MKYSFFLAFFLATQFSFGQSKLSNAAEDCEFTLAWTCDECTFKWTGECLNKSPEGIGVLTVYHGSDEIMRYEGEMKNGAFNGEGYYKDGMNEIEGMFDNGNFIDNNPFEQQRNAIIDTLSFNKTREWEQKSQFTKQIDNLYFSFPSKGYGFENRDKLLQECVEAFSANCKIIKDPDYTEFTQIIFVDSKNEMLLQSGLFIKGGAANIYRRTIHMVVFDNGIESEKRTNLPIKHEIMHMVSMTAWGIPPNNVTWLNEGLATYAANNCSGYTVSELYRFFLEEKMLISVDSLSNNFYHTEEMIGYHQSACIVEYLIDNYGLEKLEALWKNGMTNFDSIYGLSYSQLEKNLNEHILKKHPKVAEINWSVLSKGCK